MRKLFFGAAFVSLLASAPALAQAVPSLGSRPNPSQALTFGSGAVNTDSTAQAQGHAAAIGVTAGGGGLDGAFAFGGSRVNVLATTPLSPGSGISFNNQSVVRR